MSGTKPELLAPAGTLEKLKWACEYGADAIYFGCGFSLRSFAGNFTLDDAAAGLEYLHQRGKKGYVTLNIYPFTDEYDDIRSLAGSLDDMGADAFIVADLGVLTELQKMGLNAKLHISTQANTMSAQTIQAYAALGAARVNLARELSLEQIQKIQQSVAGQVETEVFVHGAVCFSYSGRCAISDYLTGRRANRGECTHPCRWKYYLVEEKRPGEYHPVAEDERGLYYFNSRDLALFEFIPTLAESGVNSLKIEGRMKSIHYVASVVSLYRQIIDGRPISCERAFELLSRVKNRGYSQGFMKGSITPDDYKIDDSSSVAEAVFRANVIGATDDGKTILEIRNKIEAGQSLEMLSPDGSISQVTLPDVLVTDYGRELMVANNDSKIVIDQPLPAYAILRSVPCDQG